MNELTDNYIKAHSKSQMASFFLTLLLGPLGLFYSSWVSALILCVIAIAGAATIVVPLICWVLAILIGGMGVTQHNEKVRASAALAGSAGTQ